MPCAVTPRDLAIVHAVWHYRYLTTPQLPELWWPGRAAWAGQRRLLKLHHAGYLDRFRPRARRGSFPWTYRVDRAGVRLLRAARVIEGRTNYEPETIYDYRYVLHDVQLNAWVIAWRRQPGRDAARLARGQRGARLQQTIDARPFACYETPST